MENEKKTNQAKTQLKAPSWVVKLFFLLVLISVSLAFLRVMYPFFLPIFLACIFTAIFWKINLFFRSKLNNNQTAAAALSVLFVFTVVAVPLTIIGFMAYFEALSVYDIITGYIGQENGGLMQIADNLNLSERLSIIPVLGNYIMDFDVLDFQEIIKQSINYISSLAVIIMQRTFVGAAQGMAGFVLILLLMFFLFKDGARLLEFTYHTLPLKRHNLEELINKTKQTTGGTLVSTVFIGLIEGAYGTILFIIFGLPSPFLWGVVMFFFSMIPIVGAGAVLIPAGIILIITGSWLAGLMLIVLAGGGLTITQNIIRPYFMGGKIELHPAIVLLSTLGGLIWLGLIGFIVGPLIAALCIVVWQQFGTLFSQELEEKDHL